VLPRNRKLINQYLLIYDGDDLYENVNREFDRARITMNLNIHGSSEIRQVMERINVRIRQNPIPNVKTDFSGFGRLFVDQERQIVQGQINSFVGAFIQILLLMTLLWRSITASLVCLIPNLAPLFFIFVIMGTTGIHLDVATALIAGVVLGITVDDTIHLYHGYLKRRQKGASPAFAIARSFESSGRAVIAISLILVSQFMLLTFSNFEPTVHFGLLCAIGLLAGQIFELLLMPALMIWWSNHHVPPASGNPSTRTLGMLARTPLQRSVRTAQ
jgi:predicted RND superfamily exporter protein